METSRRNALFLGGESGGKSSQQFDNDDFGYHRQSENKSVEEVSVGEKMLEDMSICMINGPVCPENDNRETSEVSNRGNMAQDFAQKYDGECPSYATKIESEKMSR